VETDDDHGLGSGQDERPAGTDTPGCSPARQRVQFQRFGRPGRYGWSVRRRGREDLPPGRRQ
jgi:hypothetical protein